MPEILKFEMNVPVEVALEGEGGITVAGRFGDRVMYTLTDHRRMYVAPFVARRINELGIQPGDRFRISKRQVKTGQSKSIEWQVERIAEGETQLERDLQESIDQVKARKHAPPSSESFSVVSLEPVAVQPPTSEELNAPKPVVCETNAIPEPVLNGSVNGHLGSTVPPAQHNHRPAPDTQLAHALKTAIAAAAEAEKFAQTLDYNIRFTTEDVRSMGITVLIGMQQRVPR